MKPLKFRIKLFIKNELFNIFLSFWVHLQTKWYVTIWLLESSRHLLQTRCEKVWQRTIPISYFTYTTRRASEQHQYLCFAAVMHLSKPSSLLFKSTVAGVNNSSAERDAICCHPVRKREAHTHMHAVAGGGGGGAAREINSSECGVWIITVVSRQRRAAIVASPLSLLSLSGLSLQL